MSGEELLRRFREAHGRNPDPDRESDMWAMDRLVTDQERAEILDRIFVEVTESVLLQMVADGEAEFVGVSEEGDTIFRPVRERS